MTDSDVLELVRDSLGDLRMERPIDQITMRGRTLRRRRQGVVGAAALAVLGAGATLAAALPSAALPPAAAGQAVNVDLAAWSVHTGPGSTVTLTMRQFAQPDLLRQILAKAGVRAQVQSVSVAPDRVAGCDPTPGVRKVPESGQVFGDPPFRLADGALVATIKPSAMPRGSVVGIVVFDLHRTDASAFSIGLYTGVPGRCVLPVVP